jgi:hypothetical protein
MWGLISVRLSMLIAFWFKTNRGLGYGVTAASQAEAEELLREYGCPPSGVEVTEVIRNIQHKDLEQNHVVPNAGPMVVRGVWYPWLNT